MGIFLRRGALTTKKLGDLDVGTLVKLNENGSPVEFYVAKHDYEAELNGSGRTLLVRKDCYAKSNGYSGADADFAGGVLDTLLNNTYFPVLDSGIQSKVQLTKFYYTHYADYNWTLTTLERKVFPLSVTEFGKRDTYANTEGSALPIASSLQVAQFNGTAVGQWTRTVYTNTQGYAYILTSTGAIRNVGKGNPGYYARPVFCLPAETKVGDGNLITG